jgi:hypothetical protein
MAYTDYLDTVQKIYIGYYGRAADPIGQVYWATQLDTHGGSLATIIDAFGNSAEATTLFSGMSNAAKVNAIYNQCFGRDAEVAGLTYYTNALTLGTYSQASIMLNVLNGATGTDATAVANKLATAKLYTAALDTTTEIVAYSGTTAASSARTFLATVTDVATTVPTAAAVDTSVASMVAGSSAVTGQTYALTTGVDTVAGASTNDTIDGSRAITVAGVLDTLNNADSIDGGAGTDTLFVQLTTGATVTTPASLKNVETIQIEDTGGGDTLNLVNGDSSVTKIITANNAGAVTVNNLRGIISDLEITNVANNVTIGVGTGLSGTSDSLNLKLTNVSAGTVCVQPVAAGSGYETIKISSEGTVANVLTALTDGLGTSLATVNVSGANALTLPLTDTTVVTVDANAATGILNLTVAAGNTQNMTITGGTVNDIINMNGTYTILDTINGGTGTDRLTLTNAEAVAATTTQSLVSNTEVINLSDGLNGAVAVNNFGATGLRFGGANMAGAGTVSYAAGTDSLDLQTWASGGNNLIANIAGVATNDVLGVTLGSTTVANTFGAGTVTINGAETVNLLSQGGANSFGAAFTITDTAATQALVITGSQAITFTGAVRADSVDASGMTGTATLTLTGGTSTTATTITGTANADTLNGSTAGDITTGGAGADTIANVITGTAATAGDVLTGSAGYDTFILRGDLASEAVATGYAKAAYITDFAVGSTATATDILQLSATIGNYSGGSAFYAGVAANAAGATAIQNVAQNAAAVAAAGTTDLIKLTTAGATAGITVQTAFNNAIGTATVTTLVAGDDIFFTLYDSTNSRMVVGLVDATAGVNTTVQTGDTVTLIGTVAMTAADYSTFSQNNLSIIAA